MEGSQSVNMETERQVKTEMFPLPNPDEPMDDDEVSSVSKLHSLLSLTLDEIQSKNGRSLGSMNMDEFLNSVWRDVDEMNNVPPISNLNELPNVNDGEEQHPLLRQGSFSIPSPLCSKTVEEVWAEIQLNNPPPQENPSSDHLPTDGDAAKNEKARQQSLGEMTLEDFLVKVGVIKASDEKTDNVDNNNPNYCGQIFTNTTMMNTTNGVAGQVTGYQMSANANVVGNGNTFRCNSNSSMYHVFAPTGNGGHVGEPSNNNGNVNQQSNRRRGNIASLEVAVERRQRRMIKNRESAARSRSRKQAYTAELEIELHQLREENESLKMALTEIEARKQELEYEEENCLAMMQRTGVKYYDMMRRSSSLLW